MSLIESCPGSADVRFPGFMQDMPADDLPHVREMVRQQLLGDRELLRDIDAGREDPRRRTGVIDRLQFVEGLALRVGVLPLLTGTEILT